MPSANRARLTVLSGPSGVGKGTVVARLREINPQFWVSVSATTRSPRPGEMEGREYYFVDDREFDRLIADGELLEWAPYVNLRHGTPRAPVERKLAAGVPVLLEIDVPGARQVRQAVPDARLVFLAPPSWEELVRRLTGRGTEPPDVIERRLEVAREEMAAEKEFDVTLVNTSVDEVCDELVTLMFRLRTYLWKADGGRDSRPGRHHEPADRRSSRRGGQQVPPGHHGRQAGPADQRLLRAAR